MHLQSASYMRIIGARDGAGTSAERITRSIGPAMRWLEKTESGG
jgi:hypothetical protein